MSEDVHSLTQVTVKGSLVTVDYIAVWILIIYYVDSES